MKKFDFTRILALVMAVLLSVSLVACDEETPKTDGKYEGDLEDLLEEIYAYGTYSEMLTEMLEAPSDTENHSYVRLLTIELTEENEARFLGTSGIPYERAIASEPNISPTLYSLCLLKVKEGEDVAKVAKMVKENADPRKWVCTGLSDNDVYVEYADDVVLLVMSAEDGEALAAAFRNVMKGESNEKEVVTKTKNGVYLNETAPFSILAFTDEDTVFYSTFPQNGDIFFWRLDISTGEKTECGSLQSHLFSTGNVVLKNNALYFYVTTMDDDGKPTNHFCRLDTEMPKVEVLFSESGHQTFNYLTLSESTILSTNGYVEDDGSGKTYIETIDLITKERYTLIEYQAYYEDRRGKAITNMAAYDDKMIAVVECFEDDAIVPYLYTYDCLGELIDVIDMRAYAGNLFNTAISEVVMVDDYVYLVNMSGAVLFGKIVDGTFQEIVAPVEDFVMAKCQDVSLETIVFFQRGMQSVFLLDRESDTLIEKTLSLSDHIGGISYMAVSDETLLLYLMNGNEHEFILCDIPK